jgi:hypothetical protein
MQLTAIHPNAACNDNGASSVLMPVSANLTLEQDKEQSVQVEGTKPTKAKSSHLSEVRNESVQLIPHFKQFLAFLIADVPEVRAVLMREDGKLLEVYIVVDDFNFDANERIYDKEEHIMDVFTKLDFNFHITSQLTSSDPDVRVEWSR